MADTSLTSADISGWRAFIDTAHRITESLEREWAFKGHLVQHPCNEKGHLQLNQVAQSPVQPVQEEFNFLIQARLSHRVHTCPYFIKNLNIIIGFHYVITEERCLRQNYG